MNPSLVAEIVAAQCWDSDITATLDCEVDGVSGIIMLTECSLYVLRSSGEADAAIVLEDLIDGVCETEFTVTPFGTIVRLTTIDNSVTTSVSPSAAETLRKLLARENLHNAGEWQPPRPFVVGCSDRRNENHFQDAVLKEHQLREKLVSVEGSGLLRLEITESQARAEVVRDEHAEIIDCWLLAERYNSTLSASQHASEITELKLFYTSTLRLDMILPDGGVHASLSELPLSNGVSLLLEQTEKAARSSMDSFLTSRHINARTRRDKLEAEMAIREMKSESVAAARTLAETRNRLAVSEAKCRDLETTCSSLATKLSDLQQRESIVLQRAQQREEELFAQLQRTRGRAPVAQLGSSTFDFTVV